MRTPMAGKATVRDRDLDQGGRLPGLYPSSGVASSTVLDLYTLPYTVTSSTVPTGRGMYRSDGWEAAGWEAYRAFTASPQPRPSASRHHLGGDGGGAALFLRSARPIARAAAAEASLPSTTEGAVGSIMVHTHAHHTCTVHVHPICIACAPHDAYFATCTPYAQRVHSVRICMCLSAHGGPVFLGPSCDQLGAAHY